MPSTQPVQPSAAAAAADPALAWLPPDLAPLEGELADLKALAEGLEHAARIQLAAALRGDPGPLHRIAQARLWEREKKLLLGGQIIDPFDSTVQPEQLKGWFHKLPIGVNLGNTKHKEALMNKATQGLAREVEDLSTSIQVARQHIASLQRAVAAAFLEAPIQPAATFGMPQLGGLPLGMAPQPAALQHLAATMGIPFLTLGDAAGVGLQFAPFSFAPTLFQGTQ